MAGSDIDDTRSAAELEAIRDDLRARVEELEGRLALLNLHRSVYRPN